MLSKSSWTEGSREKATGFCGELVSLWGARKLETRCAAEGAGLGRLRVTEEKTEFLGGFCLYPWPRVSDPEVWAVCARGPRAPHLGPLMGAGVQGETFPASVWLVVLRCRGLPPSSPPPRPPRSPAGAVAPETGGQVALSLSPRSVAT